MKIVLYYNVYSVTNVMFHMALPLEQLCTFVNGIYILQIAQENIASLADDTTAIVRRY
jgi:hypothetical protein